MPPLDEKPFRSEKESAREPTEAFIRMGHPRVRPHVVPFDGRAGKLTRDDFVTSFLVAWQPVPTPPAHWIELLREAPFGTQAIRARDLHWNGHFLSIELFNESDIEASRRNAGGSSQRRVCAARAPPCRRCAAPRKARGAESRPSLNSRKTAVSTQRASSGGNRARALPARLKKSPDAPLPSRVPIRESSRQRCRRTPARRR
jgi:hypothetical protein